MDGAGVVAADHPGDPADGARGSGGYDGARVRRVLERLRVQPATLNRSRRSETLPVMISKLPDIGFLGGQMAAAVLISPRSCWSSLPCSAGSRAATTAAAPDPTGSSQVVERPSHLAPTATPPPPQPAPPWAGLPGAVPVTAAARRRLTPCVAGLGLAPPRPSRSTFPGTAPVRPALATRHDVEGPPESPGPPSPPGPTRHKVEGHPDVQVGRSEPGTRESGPTCTSAWPPRGRISSKAWSATAGTTRRN